jgi:hypothetical protein
MSGSLHKRKGLLIALPDFDSPNQECGFLGNVSIRRADRRDAISRAPAMNPATV